VAQIRLGHVIQCRVCATQVTAIDCINRSAAPDSAEAYAHASPCGGHPGLHGRTSKYPRRSYCLHSKRSDKTGCSWAPEVNTLPVASRGPSVFRARTSLRGRNPHIRHDDRVGRCVDGLCGRWRCNAAAVVQAGVPVSQWPQRLVSPRLGASDDGGGGGFSMASTAGVTATQVVFPYPTSACPPSAGTSEQAAPG